MPANKRNSYVKVYDTLKREITTGEARIGSNLPSDSNLAARFKVSRPTVAKAVKLLRDEGLIKRRAGASSLIVGNTVTGLESHTFGLLIPDLGEREIFEIMCGQIARLSKKHNFTLLWDGTGDFLDDGGQHLLETVDRYVNSGVDGIFFTPWEHISHDLAINQRILSKLKENGITVTLIDRESTPFPGRSRHDLVGIDNLDAGYRLAKHLIASGSTRVGFLIRDGLAPTVSMRRLGVELAVRDTKPGQGGLHVIRIGSTMDECVDQIIESGIDGLICYNDALAADAMLALFERGVSIPDDLLLAGFDDVKYAKLLRVPLTTIQQPCRDIGEMAVKVMIDRLNFPDAPPRKVELKAELIIRQSTRKF